MVSTQIQGDLSRTPFARLLLTIWKEEKTGRLELKAKSTVKKFDFKKGDLVLTRNTLDHMAFLDFLLRTERIGRVLHREIIKHYKKHASFLKIVLETGLFTSGELWDLMKEFSIAELFPLFDWNKAEYFFYSKTIPPANEIILDIPTVPIILQGTRQMKNESLVLAALPSEDKEILAFFPDYQEEILLNSAEKYLLSQLRTKKVLKEVYTSVEFVKAQSQKMLFTLFSLGLVGLPEEKKPSQSEKDLSSSYVIKTLEAFNNKCSAIYKHISKEIGPVAFNILEKCIEDTRPHLSPLFKNIQLKPDGKIDTHSISKTNFKLSGEETKKDFLNGLTEILVSEVLTVKKTLGNEHEALLVKNLKKINS